MTEKLVHNNTNKNIFSFKVILRLSVCVCVKKICTDDLEIVSVESVETPSTMSFPWLQQ